MDVYDVIVVGGGSAGAAAAAMLSQDPNRRVLLLEAGRDWRADEAPAALRSANINPFMNDPAHQLAWQWPGLMTRRTRAQAPRFYWRGKAVGGSSVVNAQIAIRGVAAAFDSWAENGCEGWAATDVLPVFDSMEEDPGAGRTGGPIPVYRAPLDRWGPVDQALRSAALAAGYPWNPDLNAPTGEGVSCYPINSRDGRRVSTNDAYLEPARDRPNIKVQGGALVDRVLLRDGRATGVRVRLPGQGWTEIVARQVLLCADAIHSPAILMRSGLGSAADLAGLGIPVIRDLPQVGRNFMDHPILRASIRLRPEHVSKDPDQRHTNCCVTYTSGLGGGGVRDMILIGFNHRGLGESGLPSGNGAVGGALFNAFSRGTVRLVSADPNSDPEVDENMLDDPRDRLRMCDMVRRLAVLFELTVTTIWLRQAIVGLTLICHGSYRGGVEFLRDLLGIPISLGSVRHPLQAATQQAGVINHDQDLSGVRVGLHDEIFHAGKPVLAGVDAASTYCCLLVAEPHRDADTWGAHLLDATRQGLAPDHTIVDAGQGLRASQKAAWGDTPCHGE